MKSQEHSESEEVNSEWQELKSGRPETEKVDSNPMRRLSFSLRLRGSSWCIKRSRTWSPVVVDYWGSRDMVNDFYFKMSKIMICLYTNENGIVETAITTWYEKMKREWRSDALECIGAMASNTCPHVGLPEDHRLLTSGSLLCDSWEFLELLFS